MTAAKTLLLCADSAGLLAGAEVLRHGGLLAFPTETVYGLGADARNGRAVARIYAAKGRPAFNPLIVHVATVAAARALCVFNAEADILADAFWPGALTLVLPMRPPMGPGMGPGPGISELVTAGLPTLAVRVPDHPLAQALLAGFGGPVAAPSANPSGRISPTTAAHVLAGLAGRIDAVINGGACPVGLESTIISCDGPPTLLRAGGLPAEVIEAALGLQLARATDPVLPNAPGQMASHYAPQGQIRLNATKLLPAEVMLGFGPVQAALNLSQSGDLTEAAANLFGHLHRLDAMGAGHIAVSPIPEHGLGRAINDRLRRAAAPRG